MDNTYKIKKILAPLIALILIIISTILLYANRNEIVDKTIKYIFDKNDFNLEYQNIKIEFFPFKIEIESPTLKKVVIILMQK